MRDSPSSRKSPKETSLPFHGPFSSGFTTPLSSSPTQVPQPNIPKDIFDPRPSLFDSSPRPDAKTLAPPDRLLSTADSRSFSSSRHGSGSLSRTPSPKKWLVPDEAHLSLNAPEDIQKSGKGAHGDDWGDSSFWRRISYSRKEPTDLSMEQAKVLAVTRKHVSKAIWSVLTPEARQKLEDASVGNTTPQSKGKERLKDALDTTIDIAHEVLTVAADALEFVPIPGLAIGAKLILEMWNSCNQVDTNNVACLRLTQRSADILFSVRSEVAAAGDKVTAELEQPMSHLEEAFRQVNNFLLKQARRPFLKRYLKRDAILTRIQDCHQVLTDVISIFGISVQIRILRQAKEDGEAREHELQKLVDTILAQPHSSPSLTLNGSALWGSSTGMALQDSFHLSNNSIPSDLGLLDFQEKQVRNLSPPIAPSELPGLDKDVVFPSGPDYIPYALNDMWKTQFPLPPSHTPQLPPQLPSIAEGETLSPHEAISHIYGLQNSIDAEVDQLNLKSALEAALHNGRDSEIINTLQVRPDEIPEAIKALQRARERINEGDAPAEAVAPIQRWAALRRKSASLSRAAKAMIGNRTAGSSKSPSPKSSPAPTESNQASLDREFIETGIDALMRISEKSGTIISCPSWTITRYEIDRYEMIGHGFFSTVYRGKYRSQTVAIKFLSSDTPRNLFQSEVAIWKGLRHKNVLELIGASSATSEPSWFLVTPFMINGNLPTYLRREKEHLGEADLLKAIHQISKGMEYLHGKGVLHGNLKAVNVLVDKAFRCVISDFGQSEMKSEAYRRRGLMHSYGTVQWQAPELLTSNCHLTAEMDVFAFAMCCVEVLNYGGLPWLGRTEDAIRVYILEERKRPHISSENASLKGLIVQCWDQEPEKRPRFNTIVKDLKGIRIDAGQNVTEEPSLPLPTADPSDALPASPDMRPRSLLPEPDSPTQSDSSSYRTAETELIDTEESVQDTPSLRGDKSLPYTSSQFSQQTFDSLDTTSGTASTTSEERGHGVPPTPYSYTKSRDDLKLLSSSEAVASAKNERRYRLLLRHDYHQSLTLPIWNPIPVSVGAVGYLSKPAGKFVTLFNAFDPAQTSDGQGADLGSLYGYPNLAIGVHKETRLSPAQRGLDKIKQKLPFHSKNSSDPVRFSRHYFYQLRAGRREAYLCTETTQYRYIVNLEGPKKWFKANVDTIMQIYGIGHHITREDLCLVVGTLDAPNHAQFVSHHHSDSHLHFNVYSSQQRGQAWGEFLMDTCNNGGRAGPVYDPEEQALIKPRACSRVSSVGGPWETVLVARLRFKPDAVEPTSR